MRTDVLVVAAAFSLNAAVVGAASPASAWRVPGAAARILLAPAASTSHTLRVDFPLELCASSLDLSAFTSTGKTVGCRPVFMGTRVVGAELAISRQTAVHASRKGRETTHPDLAIDLYLVPPRKTAAPPTPAASRRRTPVALTRRLARYFTRPFLGSEMLRLQCVPRHGFSYTLETPEITPTLPYAKWASPPARYTAVLHWETEIRIEKKVPVRFGANALNTAWFIFVDDAFTAGWKEGSPPIKKYRFGKALELDPGFHRLDFFVYQRASEIIPTLVWQRGSAPPCPIPANLLFPTRRPPAFRIERPGGKPAIGLEVQSLTRWIFPETGAVFTELSATGQRARNTEKTRLTQTLSAPGIGAASLPVAGLLFPASALPALTLSVEAAADKHNSITLPGRFVWGPVQSASPHLDVRDLATVLAPEQPLTAKCRVLDVPSPLKKAFSSADVLRWETLDAQGRKLAEGVAAANAGTTVRPLSVPLDNAARSLILRLDIGGKLSVATPFVIRLPVPDRPLPPLTVRGNRLFAKNAFAVLRPAASGAREETGLANSASVRTRPARIAIVDDFWATAAGPNATLQPESRLGKHFGVPGVYLGIDAPRFPGTLRRLRKFALLSAAVDKPGTVVIWAVGAADLRAGKRPVDLCLDLLVLAQATRASGCTPVLCSLPPLPGIPAAALRETALLVKELAFRSGVPVVDFYSKSLLEHPGPSRDFTRFFLASDGRTGLRTPNDSGRLWLTQVAEDALRPLFSTGPATEKDTAR